MTPKIVWESEQGEYRIVKNDSVHIEKCEGADAMGVLRWVEVTELPAEILMEIAELLS